MKYIRIFLAFAFLLCMASATLDSSSSEIIPESINASHEIELISYSDEPIAFAVEYLLSCQNRDGGFGPLPGRESSLVPTCQAVVALTSMGKNLSTLPHGSPLPYLQSQPDLLANQSNVEAQTGRLVVALSAAGGDPCDVGGNNYLQTLKGYCSPSGEIGKKGYIWDDAWVIFGLAACNESGSQPVLLAVEYLKSLQTASGGWSWQGSADGVDPDTTCIVVCALLAGGEDADSPSISKALAYLKSEQNPDGGFSSLGSNAATDGWAILTIRAAGQNPAQWKVGSADPVHHLLSLQTEDGSVWWKSDSEGMSFEWTANMILALTGGRMPPVVYGQGG